MASTSLGATPSSVLALAIVVAVEGPEYRAATRLIVQQLDAIIKSNITNIAVEVVRQQKERRLHR